MAGFSHRESGGGGGTASAVLSAHRATQMRRRQCTAAAVMAATRRRRRADSGPVAEALPSLPVLLRKDLVNAVGVASGAQVRWVIGTDGQVRGYVDDVPAHNHDIAEILADLDNCLFGVALGDSEAAAHKLLPPFSLDPGDGLTIDPAALRPLLACPYQVASEAGDPVRDAGASSTSEATVSSLTVPAGALGTGGKAVLEILGHVLQNRGAANTATLRVKFGSTTVYSKATSIANAAQPKPFVLRVHVQNLGATNKQRVQIELIWSFALTATAGNGDWGEFGGRGFCLTGSSTEDTTAGQAVSVTVQWDNSSASSYWRVHSAKVTVEP